MKKKYDLGTKLKICKEHAENGISKTVFSRNKLNRNFEASSHYDKLATDI